MSKDTPAQVQESLRARDADELERNKQVARQVIDRIFVHQDDAAIDELVSDRFVPRTFGPMPPGREGLREACGAQVPASRRRDSRSTT